MMTRRERQIRPFRGKKENVPDDGFDVRFEEHDELRRSFGRLRSSIHAAAERPDDFWTRQRSAIFQKIRTRRRTTRRVPVYACLAIGIVLLLCQTRAPEKNETYAFSFAAGDDQDLLLEVERALNRQYPKALAPARHLSRELENAAAAGKTDTNFENTP